MAVLEMLRVVGLDGLLDLDSRGCEIRELRVVKIPDPEEYLPRAYILLVASGQLHVHTYNTWICSSVDLHCFLIGHCCAWSLPRSALIFNTTMNLNTTPQRHTHNRTSIYSHHYEC